MHAPQCPTVLIVPGLREHVPQHWQTLLAAQLPQVHTVPPMGRADLDCQTRVRAIEQALHELPGPVLMVAHSGGCIMVAHWAQSTRHAGRVRACLLATPPDFERPMPADYPSMQMLRAGRWLPVPRSRLPFDSRVAASRNDPLGSFERVQALAQDWGSAFEDLGDVGHLNPASGFGPWPRARDWIEELTQPAGHSLAPAQALPHSTVMPAALTTRS
jgi:hypothetical protein